MKEQFEEKCLAAYSEEHAAGQYIACPFEYTDGGELVGPWETPGIQAIPVDSRLGKLFKIDELKEWRIVKLDHDEWPEIYSMRRDILWLQTRKRPQ